MTAFDSVRDDNIARAVFARAAAQPQQLAVACPVGRRAGGRTTYAELTYAQLATETRQLSQALLGAGLAPGARVAVMVPPSLPFFVVTFALFHAGLVPVFIDPGMRLASLKRCLAEAAPVAFIGSAKAHLARVLFGWCRGQLGWRFQVGGGLAAFATPLARLAIAAPPAHAASADATAAILFTSGSTGAPKGAVYQHATFAAQIHALQELLQIQPGEVDLCTFPLFALFAPALGMTAVVPQMDFTRPARAEPERLLEAVSRFDVTNLFGSPALLRVLARHAGPRGLRLPSLRRAIAAGAPVSPGIVRDFARLLAPGVELYTPYGATEALPVACIGSAEILAETAAQTAAGCGVCVGRPAPGIQLGVMPTSDAAVATWDMDRSLPPGAIGEIVVAGPQVTARYFARPEADALAKTRRLGDGAVIHRMGDLGYVDERGRLWYCGRKAHRVVTAKGDLYTDPCEGVFNAVAGVYRTALVGRGERGAMAPVLCVEADARLSPRQQGRLRAQLLATAAAQPQTADVKEVRFFRSLPVDTRHNAKIFREQLKARIDAGHA